MTIPARSDRRGKPLSQELISQIRRLRLVGHSYRETATISGVAKSTIEIYCKHFPAGSKPGPKVKPKAVWDPTSIFEDDDDDEYPYGSAVDQLELEADNWLEDTWE